MNSNIKIIIKYRIWLKISRLFQNIWFKCACKRDEYKMLWIRKKIKREASQVKLNKDQKEKVVSKGLRLLAQKRGKDEVFEQMLQQLSSFQSQAISLYRCRRDNKEMPISVRKDNVSRSASSLLYTLEEYLTQHDLLDEVTERKMNRIIRECELVDKNFVEKTLKY